MIPKAKLKRIRQEQQRLFDLMERQRDRVKVLKELAYPSASVKEKELIDGLVINTNTQMHFGRYAKDFTIKLSKETEQ